MLFVYLHQWQPNHGTCGTGIQRAWCVSSEYQVKGGIGDWSQSSPGGRSESWDGGDLRVWPCRNCEVAAAEFSVATSLWQWDSAALGFIFCA